ncbi:MAG: hypothetical protein GF392_04140, partial [Candidatus Omnitrophica bacterium]|nr:hypothetical protein [Candidatus Omnitrophota bacterium]
MKKRGKPDPRGRCLSEVLAERLYTRAVKTEAIDRETDIPEEELDEFRETRTAFIKNRVRLLGVLAVCAYITVMFGLYLVDPLQVRGAEMGGGLLLILAGGLLLYFNSRADSISRAKLNAVLFTVLLLILLVKFGLFYVGAGALMSALVLMVTMFLVAITIPWRPVEVLGIGALHLATYAALFTPWIDTFHNISVYNRASDGGVFLLIGLFLCVIIRLKEEQRDMENFVLFKKVERNNTRMSNELRLATRIHRNLIPD